MVVCPKQVFALDYDKKKKRLSRSESIKDSDEIWETSGNHPSNIKKGLPLTVDLETNSKRYKVECISNYPRPSFLSSSLCRVFSVRFSELKAFFY